MVYSIYFLGEDCCERMASFETLELATEAIVGIEAVLPDFKGLIVPEEVGAE